MSRRRNTRTEKSDRPRSRRDRSRTQHAAYRHAVHKARAARSVPNVPLGHLEPGDIVDAFVEFDDGTGFKRRPVVVFRADRHTVVGLRCSTQVGRHHWVFRGINEWEEAGLARPCGVNVRNSVKVDRTSVLARIGRLTESDLARLGLTAAGTNDAAECSVPTNQRH